MTKRIISLFLVLVLSVSVFVLSSCGDDKTPGGVDIGDNSEQTPSDSSGNVSYTAPDGSVIELPKTVSKIAVVSPAVVSILDKIGSTSKMSASYDVAEDCTDDIITSKPDVVFYDAGAALDVDAIKSAGIVTVEFPACDSMATVKQQITFIGKVTGAATEKFVDSITKALNVMQISMSNTIKQKVYIELGESDEGFKTAAPYSYVYELVSSAGGKNIFGEDSSYEGFITVSGDDIISADPEVIFTTGSVDDIINRAGWENVTAIKNGHVYKIENLNASYDAVLAAESMHDTLNVILYGESTEEQ